MRCTSLLRHSLLIHVPDEKWNPELFIACKGASECRTDSEDNTVYL